MTSSPREEFSAEVGASVVAKASALLASIRKTSLHPVERAWCEMDHSTYQGQKRTAPTLVLVKALTLAHDDARDTVLWPTPEEEQEERRRVRKQRGDSRDRGKDHHRGGGGSGDGDSGGGDSQGGGGGPPPPPWG